MVVIVGVLLLGAICPQEEEIVWKKGVNMTDKEIGKILRKYPIFAIQWWKDWEAEGCRFDLVNGEDGKFLRILVPILPNLQSTREVSIRL